MDMNDKNSNSNSNSNNNNNNTLYFLFLQMDLEPGCSISMLNERYRDLASLFHPDQVTGTRRKELAEREMKALNDRRERLLAHLKSPAHSLLGDCICRKIGPDNFSKAATRPEQSTSHAKPQAQAASQKQQEKQPQQKHQHQQQPQQNSDQRRPDTNAWNGPPSAGPMGWNAYGQWNAYGFQNFQSASYANSTGAPAAEKTGATQHEGKAGKTGAAGPTDTAGASNTTGASKTGNSSTFSKANKTPGDSTQKNGAPGGNNEQHENDTTNSGTEQDKKVKNKGTEPTADHNSSTNSPVSSPVSTNRNFDLNRFLDTALFCWGLFFLVVGLQYTADHGAYLVESIVGSAMRAVFGTSLS